MSFTGSKRAANNREFLFTEGPAVIAVGNGNYVEAEALYRRALAITPVSNATTDHARFSELALARVLMRQGRLMEAEEAVRGTISRAYWAHGLVTLLPAIAASRLGEILYEQGRLAEAEAIANLRGS